ncbi:MAG: ATP-grasp domain-containing protein [Deltaproteobacteria bacterium]|nr:ATP-grasp domain-containing protein [Deltaproteobacteria bacterium]
MNRVMVTGIGGPAGRSAVEYFKRKGEFLIGTDVRETGPAVDEFALLPLAKEPSFTAALLHLIKEKRPGLFVPTVTEELDTVSALKGEIESLGCRVFISPPASVKIANDKLRTAVFMSINNIPVPATYSGDTHRETVIRELGLPLLAKPSFGRGGRGVVVFESAKEALGENRKGIIFQEFIPGDEFDVNMYIDRRGIIRAAVALKKTELKEGVVGNALRVERAVRTDAVELCKRAARSLNLEGPLDFDVRLRADGTPALLEINARLGGNVLSAVEVLDSLDSEFKDMASKA